jgi:hypothetical protein
MPVSGESSLQRLRAGLRQLRYPAPFRIAPPAVQADLRAGLEDLVARERARAPLPKPVESDDSSPGPDPESLAAAATGLWRLRMRMMQKGTDQPLPEMRRAFRHLQSTWDALAGAGVEIQDHDGMPFDTGQTLSVLAFQPGAGLDRERVIETVRPTVYLRGRCIQIGEVIVGTPDLGAADDPTTETP